MCASGARASKTRLSPAMFHSYILPPCEGTHQDRDSVFKHLDAGILSHHIFIILLHTGGN